MAVPTRPGGVQLPGLLHCQGLLCRFLAIPRGYGVHQGEMVEHSIFKKQGRDMQRVQPGALTEGLF